MDWRNEVESAQDFVESLKSDVFQEHIYVFTPQGDIVELPKGATPIDFAYRIHTDLGHQVGRREGQRPPRHPRHAPRKRRCGAHHEGQKPRRPVARLAPVRPVHQDRQRPRSKVRQWFSSQRRDEKITQGRAILDQTLKHLGLEQRVALADMLEYFPRYKDLDDFLEAIGNTDLSPQ